LGRKELLLNGKQCGDLDIMGMQVDFDYRIVEDLKFDEAQVPHGEGSGIIIRFGIPQCRAKFDAVLEHPRALGRNKHRQAVHETLARSDSDNLPEITDFIHRRLTADEPRSSTFVSRCQIKISDNVPQMVLNVCQPTLTS